MSQSRRVSRIQFAIMVDTVLWRILAFARSLNAWSPWLAKQLRRSVLLAWWAATFQLHTHVRYWVRARRLRRLRPSGAPAPVLEAVDPGSLEVPHSHHPIVSIIIPTYGQIPFTLRCLASIAKHAPALPIEVIVVDDAWRDTDARWLDLIRGIRLIRNETNLGFLHSCNKAAAAAKGQYLYFLNNDTQVLDGWIEPMVHVFENWPGTGAVGAKLLYPDGRLQEAGAIIWQDASGWNFGRLEDPAGSAYNYIREVDYCSGAALMVQRLVFAKLGGFDARYAPAYYEDTDLCFRLRLIGLKTMYQPDARIVHHEGISHGRDTAVGIKSCQVLNRRLFAEQWADVLARQHYPNGRHVMRARDRAMHRKIVLVIDHYVPTPDRDAGSCAIMACLHVLVQADFVVKFWPHNQSYSPGYTEVLQSMGIEVFHGPRQPGFASWIKAAGGEFDTILISRPEVAEDVIALIRRYSHARIIYYGHDLHFRRMHQQAEVTGDEWLLRQAHHMRERERALWLQADLSLYLSDEEVRIALELQPDAKILAVTPYFFDRFADPRVAVPGQEIVFVAGFGHPPNEDAAVWFTNEVLPLIRAELPGAHLSIIGSCPTEPVQALTREGTAVFANVSEAELSAAYARARVAVVPLRCGAGVKLKVIEALRDGVPLVTTSVGAQGLPGLSSIAEVEDDPATFARAVVLLLRNDIAWEDASRRQVDYARTRFSRSAMAASFLAALETSA